MTLSKYGAKPTMLDGIRFASQAEAARYAELRMLEKAGQISDLVVQPEYPLHARGGIFIGFYLADFRYVEHQASGDRIVVEDVKGVRTQIYRWKKKHAEAEHDIRIVEIRR